jgi:hypothetical protein
MRPNELKMPEELCLHGGGPHGDAVCVPLAAPHDDLGGCEVDILDPQTAALEQPEPRPGGPVRHQPGRAGQPLQHGPHRIPGTDHRPPPRALRAHEAVAPRDVEGQDVPVEEQPRAQRLVRGRGGHRALDRKRGQQARDLRCAHRTRVALAVQQDGPADPGDIRLLGAAEVMAGPQSLANTIEEAGFT